MLNVIRTCPSRVKYCGATVDNLIESNGGEYHPHLVVSTKLDANANGLLALEEGIRCSNGEAFCFLEDDLSFIAEFGRSATDFARDCRGMTTPIIPLCAGYGDALDACRGLAWRYPVAKFYGTQAFVIQPEAARDLIKFARAENPVQKRGFDLLIKRWVEKQGIKEFLTPHRCFVQHVGVETSMHRGNRFHHYKAWGGRNWTYRSGAFSMAEQKNRPCDKPLAAAIAQWFGTKLPAYDLGCSTGQYVRCLDGHGVNTTGFDATIGLEGSHPSLKELDLARPQLFTEKPGNVMCLEVAEHIHPEDEPHFLSNIKSLCADKLVLSWAVPGQGGKRHVNEKSGHDVFKLMESIGFKMDGKTIDLQQRATISWFKDSLYAFQRA